MPYEHLDTKTLKQPIICSVSMAVGDIMEKLFPIWHLQLKWNCLPRPLVFSCQNVIKTTQKKKNKENKGKCNQNNQRASEKKRIRDTRRKYLISLPMDALKCHLLSWPLLLLLLPLSAGATACHILLPSCQLPFVMPLPREGKGEPSLPCVVLCRLSSLYEL